MLQFNEEVNVDLSSWSPSQYWEARLADNRMVGLFVIENFDETKVHFEYDKREIIVRIKQTCFSLISIYFIEGYYVV